MWVRGRGSYRVLSQGNSEWKGGGKAAKWEIVEDPRFEKRVTRAPKELWHMLRKPRRVFGIFGPLDLAFIDVPEADHGQKKRRESYIKSIESDSKRKNPQYRVIEKKESVKS